MPVLTILHQNKQSRLNVQHGEYLLDILRSNGYEIYSPCGGQGKCGKCNILMKGEGYVSSCLYPVNNDIEITLPGKSEAKILSAQYEFSRVLPFSPGKSVTLSKKPFGVAVDIGTTTLALYLVDLLTGSLVETRTALNPQAKYGADVISRINYCILNPGGLKTLQDELLKAINKAIVHFTGKFGLHTDDMVKLTFSGNTTMLHLLLGENPESLAFVPFTPVFTDEKSLTASALDLSCNKRGGLKVLPSLAAYIGADIVAGLASLAPVENFTNFLFIDVGTNGEMALITPETIYCCATAAGPAFEGASIKHGMGAMEGAISEYYKQGDYRTIGNARPKGICGSGLIDLAAFVLQDGLADTNGNMDEDFVIASSAGAGIPEDILLTQQDIREIQLAKSAVASGIAILLKKAGLATDQLDALYLAGGFGNYIRTESAVRIGLLPEELSEKVIPVGNTSGTAALLALKSEDFSGIIGDIRDRMICIELNEEPDFIEAFAMNMMFP